MCFKKLTFKNVLTSILLLFTLGALGLALIPSTTLAGNGSVDPPPPDADTTIVYTATGPVDGGQAAEEPDPVLSTWDIITIVASTIL